MTARATEMVNNQISILWKKQSESRDYTTVALMILNTFFKATDLDDIGLAMNVKIMITIINISPYFVLVFSCEIVVMKMLTSGYINRNCNVSVTACLIHNKYQSIGDCRRH